MTPEVKKIILSISVWPVHLWAGVIPGNRSAASSEENNRGFIYSAFFYRHIHTDVNPKGHVLKGLPADNSRSTRRRS